MSTKNTSAQRRHIIFLDGKNSTTVAPYGQKNAFPIENIDYTDLGSRYDGSKTYRNCNYPSFTTYNLKYNPSVKYAEGVNELDEKLFELREQQKPIKITLVTLVNMSRADSSTSADIWEKVQEQELPDATVHLVDGTTCTYQIIADKAVLGVGDKATDKKPINFRDNTAA